MLNKFAIGYGKPACVILYAVFTALLANGIWIPFAVLVIMHLTEYAVIGFKVAKQNGYGIIPGFLHCLCFGFTWWLPIKNRESKNEKD